LCTAFCEPATVGGCEQKDQQNPLGGRPSVDINVGAAVGGHQFPGSIAGRQLITESFAQNRCFLKIWVGPSASRSLGLKMKKLLDDSLNLT
jgi:hypothetical protein